MINVTKLSFSFPEKDLYNDVSFSIKEGQSAAFIGSSGSGKSTLATILMDLERYVYDGKIIIADHCKLGYISQSFDVDRNSTVSVFDYIAVEFTRIQDEITRICAEMETATDIEPLLEAYQSALDAFEAIDGDNYEMNINKKLGLAGLMPRRDLDVSKLSGGEFKLVQVIKQMLSTPNFIIMDEPDSFLDFENLNALKNLINAHKGTMLTITHSRYLLNHCFNKIIHLEDTQIQEFDGNYADYNFDLLSRKIDIQELAFADTEEIERNDAMIIRLEDLASEVSSPVHGRVLKARRKVQERLVNRRIDNPFICVEEPAFNFEASEIEEDTTLLTVTDFSLTFDELLLENVNFTIKAGDKVAIIGANGTGKTSLIRKIYENKTDSIEINPETVISYLSQNQNETFPGDGSIFDAFFDLGFSSFDQITEYLTCFKFPIEKLNQKVGTLSGGEQNTLALAKVSCENSNLLILDEPTSHLDTYAQIALERAISEYKGAILMISHDFYSIVNCMDYVFILENHTLRQIKMRKFRKMIYAHHFTKDYLALEESKKAMETKIELALSKNDFEGAKLLLPELEAIINAMK